MARNVRLDFRRGGGSSLEVLYGKVSLTPTNLHTLSSTAVLPAPTTFDLVNGTALATNVAPTPAPVDGLLPWAYKVKITDNFGKTWEYIVGVPDGTTEINFNVLPRYSETRPPAFGVGPAGPAGQAATIAIGTTTSGTTPAVTNTGTSTDAVLNFQLPKGDKGDKGDNSTYLGFNVKNFADAPSTYPNGMSTHRGTVGSGWPSTVGVTTSYSGAAGTGWQIIKDYNTAATPQIRWANGTTTDTWGAFQPLLPGLATPLMNGLMPALDKAKLDNMILPSGSKSASAAPDTYPIGVSIVYGSSAAGWPNARTDDGATNVSIVTHKPSNASGGVIQFVRDFYRETAPLNVRYSNNSNNWSNFSVLATDAYVLERLPLNFLDNGGVNDGVTDNSEALTAFVARLASEHRVGYFPNGDYLFKSYISFPANSSDYGLRGESKHGTRFLFRPDGVPSAPTSFSGVGLSKLTLSHFTLDAGFTRTATAGHGMSFRNAESCLFDNLFIRDHGNAAIMCFADNELAGQYGRNTISNTEADGLNNSNNGFLFVNMEGCHYINVTARNGGKNAWNSPSSGIQFKNRCTNSHATNVAAYGYKDGIGLGGDTEDFGPMGCTVVGGAAYDCFIGISMGKNDSNHIQATVANCTQNAVRLAQGCTNNLIELYVRDSPAGSTPAHFGSHFNTVVIKRLPQGVSNVATIVEGATYNTLLVEDRYGPLNQSIAALVTNYSLSNTNTVGTRDALYSGTTLTSGGTASFRFYDPAGTQNYIAHTGSNSTFSFRSDGSNIFTVAPNLMSAGTDNVMALGSAGRRFTQVYASNGTINTSDEREKQDISTNLDPELRAWAKVDFVKFKWKEAVDAKGKKARWHFGVLAQDVKRAFESEGLDPFEYGILCYDSWDDVEATYDDDGDEITPPQKAGDRYGVRYDEAMALEVAYLRSQLNK